MGTTVVTPAESAPAQPTPNFEPETWSGDQHSEWMRTGKVPPSKTAESTPQESAGAAKADEPAPESAPVTSQEHKPKGFDARKDELNREIQTLLKQRNDLKREVEGRPGVNADSPTAKPEKKLEEPKAPTFGEAGHENETWADFEGRQQAHTSSLVDYRVKRALQEEREANEKARKEADTKAANEAIERSWQERITATEADHADWREVIEGSKLPISPTMDGFILDSEIGPKVLYHLCKNPDLAKQVFEMSPWKAGRKLIEIEAQLAGGKPNSQSAPEAPITKAAKPTTDLAARGGGVADPVKAAVEADDYTAFEAAQNAKVVARRKRG